MQRMARVARAYFAAWRFLEFKMSKNYRKSDLSFGPIGMYRVPAYALSMTTSSKLWNSTPGSNALAVTIVVDLLLVKTLNGIVTANATRRGLMRPHTISRILRLGIFEPRPAAHAPHLQVQSVLLRLGIPRDDLLYPCRSSC